MQRLRLILDQPADGAWNMAADEALLESAANAGTATLRLYSWREPTLSLGYFQAAADRQTHQASRDCPLVRRASGGGAILHDRELTYSLALSERSGRADAARRLYDVCHATLIAVLTELGIAAKLHGANSSCETDNPTGDQPFLCFQRRTCFDIVAAGAKIVGSAQRRRRGGILQHGSILLGQSAFTPELPGIREIAGRPISASEIAGLWPPRLAGELRNSLAAGSLTSAEHSRAEVLCRERFTAQDWIYRR